ncbi:MAG: glycosyltransferase [Chitinophagaceae bacterium]|nr:glycosyltransferase [Oligoflexus sp.]
MKPTVWHLCSNRWNSAITEYALRSAQSLHRRGWSSLLSALPASPCALRASELGVAGATFQFKLSEVFALRREAKRLKPSIIVTYGGPETFLSRFLGVPVVRFRGQDSDLSRPLSPFGLGLSLRFCKGIITPAKRVSDLFRAALPKKSVHSIVLGLDAAVFHSRPRKDADRPRLLIVGRLDPIKGHEKFLKLFYETLIEWDNPRPKPFLEIIGQSANITSAALRATAKTIGLIEGVDWGLVDARVPNLPSRMASAALGIIPSLGSEVICRVAEEFLLSGTAVLVAPVGSLSECLIDPEFGAVFPDDEEKQRKLLKTWSIRAFEETQNVRDERSAKARDYFSLDSMGRDLEAYLQGFLT